MKVQYRCTETSLDVEVPDSYFVIMSSTGHSQLIKVHSLNRVSSVANKSVVTFVPEIYKQI